MATPPFDAAKAVTFDLTRGLIEGRGGASSVLVPVDILSDLCGAAGSDATAAFARALGEAVGSEVRRRLQAAGADARTGSIEAVLDQLAGAWATIGLGSLSIERWGRALVFVADHVPLQRAHDGLLAAALGAALAGASRTDCRCVALAREGERVRMLVTSAAGVSQAAAWLEQGISWGEVLVRLHAPPSGEARP